MCSAVTNKNKKQLTFEKNKTNAKESCDTHHLMENTIII